MATAGFIRIVSSLSKDICSKELLKLIECILTRHAISGVPNCNGLRGCCGNIRQETGRNGTGLPENSAIVLVVAARTQQKVRETEIDRNEFALSPNVLVSVV